MQITNDIASEPCIDESIGSNQPDACLSLAKSLGRDELANVIVLLRKARNEVVWKMGM